MNKIVFSIGKFNPPHIGHYEMFNELQQLAKEQDASPMVFVIDTGKRSLESPLTAFERMTYLQEMFPQIIFEYQSPLGDIYNNAFNALVSLFKRTDKYVPVGEVTGSDRSYKNDVKRVFGDTTDDYVCRVLHRGTNSDVTQASSTLMRTAVKNRDFPTFLTYSGLSRQQAEKLYVVMSDYLEM